MGKQAVRAGLNLIDLQNVTDAASHHIAFGDNLLERHCASVLGARDMIRDDDIRAALLAML